MNSKTPQNSPSRPNWYKIRLPPHLTKWVIECLEEEVNLKRYQAFKKVCISCKNNGRTIFVRVLFEHRLYRGAKEYGSESDLVGLPVSYLIDVNRGVLKGNSMKYDLGDNVLYRDVFPVYDQVVNFDPESKFNREKYRLFKYISKFNIPRVKS